jgi:L-threonylcarbamoyladenylate synthase
MTYSANTRLLSVNPTRPEPEVIRVAATVFQSGGLVAFPTETVYGLGANALDAEAVGRIFSAKDRPASDPIIVHIHDWSHLESVAINIPELAYDLARTFWPGPLTLVLRRHANIPPNVSAGMDTVAVRIPNHPVALALLQTAALPIAAPSANRFARPSATTAWHVLDDLNGRVDVILDGGPALIGVESTILDLTKAKPTVLRPGGVTLESLRTFIPDIQVISKHLREDEQGIDAPGMLYKHYSPRAQLLFFTGESESVITAMQTCATEQITLGKRVGVLIPHPEQSDFAHIPVKCFLLGDNLVEISHNLFAGIRALDATGVDVILVHDFGRKGLGAALWDRLLRAAEGHFIPC